MKFLVVFALLGAFAVARPSHDQTVSVSQDTAGNYKVDVNVHGIRKVEQGHADGSVVGSYSYIDSNGHNQIIQYTAGRDGYRVVGGSPLPVGPIDTNVPAQDTPEVAHLKALHLAKHAELAAQAAAAPHSLH